MEKSSAHKSLTEQETKEILESPPEPSAVQSTLGQYQILQSIGKGGMGEVFLAYDTVCGRKIALKRIRADLVEFPQIQKRFLREARITSQLMHPAIIPIYSIHTEKELIYYAMPYVEGDTLRQIIRHAKEDEKKQKPQKLVHASIPFLIRHFLQVCQAVAYAHSRGILHRDLKPENIIVGKYGQLFILDWGLAKILGDEEEIIIDEQKTKQESHRITRLGKVVGTISYMAPERALGNPASIQTDIYSLGVMLYQILTLHLPFKRRSLASFRKLWTKEQLVAPEVMAPYRDVPPVLSEVVKKCLAVSPDARYRSVDQLIQSIENYLEGRSEWFSVRSLNIHKKEDWQFQENILLAEHTAITRATEVSDWVSLMISKDVFRDNIKIEAHIEIGKNGYGIGFLFCIPETMDRRNLTEGYCLWVASENETVKTTKLLLSSVSVLEAPEIVLKSNQTYDVRIEKVEDRVSFYLNDVLQFSHISHIPVVGTQIGILSRDADFEIDSLEVFVGSQNIAINCLAVPDAFLANKMYDNALSEYRRLGSTFPGRAEGREALFRAGITLLEEAKNQPSEKERTPFFDLALEEFGNLRHTPGAPLEYLGKSFVYNALNEYEEEAKCFELALRRYRYNPLLSIIEEQIVFRMHESSRQHRIGAYYFIGLVTRFLKEWAERPSAVKLFSSLQKNWEIPFFILHTQEEPDPELKRLSLCLGVGFWLAKPHILAESTEDLLQRPIVAIRYLADALFLLVELGAYPVGHAMMQRIRTVLSKNEQERHSHTLQLLDILLGTKQTLQNGLLWLNGLSKNTLDEEEERLIWFLLRRAIDLKEEKTASHIVENLINCKYIGQHQEILDALVIEQLLYQNDIQRIEAVLKKYPLERLSLEASPLYFVYACYIAMTQGVQMAFSHFSKLLDIAFPRSWLLGAHFLAGKIHMTPAGWFSRSFLWERRALCQQLALFWYSAKDDEKARGWKTLLTQEQVDD